MRSDAPRGTRPRRRQARSGPWAAIGGALALAGLIALLPVPEALAADESPQEMAEHALMCFCGCADLTIRTCSCGTAARVKQDIASRLANGATVDQVIEAYVAQHGEQIRSAPTKQGFNLLAWVVPFAAILAAGGLIIVLVRRWQARGAVPGVVGAPAGSASPLANLTGADRKVLERVEREFRRDL
jgi:cytochrome c-type biogenesis protein CcmH